jgi:nucleoside-diphosphate-sugar epimerase
VYNVGGGTEASLHEIVAALEELAGRRLDIQAYEAAPGDVRRTAANTTRIRDELGWRPRTPLAEGLAAQCRWTVDERGEAVDESARAGAPA